MTPVVSIASRKGGVGKSYATTSLAHEFAIRSMAAGGKPVLVIDTDSQESLSKVMLDRVLPEGSPTLLDILKDKKKPAQSAIYQASDAFDHCFVIPACPAIGHFDSLVAANPGLAATSPKMMSRIIKEVSDNYSIVLIDHPPNVTNVISRSSFCASSAYISPMDLCEGAITGVQDVMQIINELKEDELLKNIKCLGAFFSKYEKSSSIAVNCLTEMARKSFGKHFLSALSVPAAIATSQAVMNKSTLQDERSNKVSLAYQAIADHIQNQLKIKWS